MRRLEFFFVFLGSLAFVKPEHFLFKELASEADYYKKVLESQRQDIKARVHMNIKQNFVYILVQPSFYELSMQSKNFFV